MSDLIEQASEVSRITCIVHQQLDGLVTECLRALGAQTVLLESARCVRQRVRSRFFGLPGVRVELNDSPMEIFRTTVRREAALRVLRELVEAADLRTPGRGAVYVQDVLELSRFDPPHIEPDDDATGGAMRDLTLISGILSMPGSGEELARIALKLGAGVPVVSLGVGTGIRDRLGLLRITIPREKEVVRLIVPSHDAAALQRLLVEEGRLDRPGGGFLYQTPIRAGVVDPLMRIGRQEHAASMEQVIAALDDLKNGTTWRKRFAGLDPADHGATRLLRNHREIVFSCSEGRADGLVQAAVRAGAAGATTSRVRCLSFSDVEGGIAARERGILCVPAALQGAVLESLRCSAESCSDGVCRLQVVEAPAVFSHSRRR